MVEERRSFPGSHTPYGSTFEDPSHRPIVLIVSWGVLNVHVFLGGVRDGFLWACGSAGGSILAAGGFAPTVPAFSKPAKTFLHLTTTVDSLAFSPDSQVRRSCSLGFHEGSQPSMRSLAISPCHQPSQLRTVPQIAVMGRSLPLPCKRSM